MVDLARPLMRRVYSKAPIVEAVVDFRLAFASQDWQQAHKAFAEAVRDTFPEKQAVQMVSVGFEAQPGGALNASARSQADVGWKLFSESHDRILQINDSGFTYSHLAPYTKWEVFSGEALPLWQKFFSYHPGLRVQRMATRYINRIKLPAGCVELEEFLTLSPNVPKEYGSISGLLMQVQVPKGSLGECGQAQVTIASEVQPDPTFQSLILDIDVFHVGSYEASDPEIWGLLARLRDAKNRLFEAALTEKLKETFL